MKAMLKSELAREAGVSVRTLNRWCEMYRKELTAMGWRPKMKMLPPNIVAFFSGYPIFDLLWDSVVQNR